MNPSARLLNLELSSVYSSRPLYASFTCRHEVISRRSLARQIRCNSSDAGSLTERLRRKIWGTDSPPGLKDPYGGQGFFERQWGNKRRPEQEGERDTEETDIAPPDSYVGATTSDGLERIGHLRKWTDYSPSEADVYRPFMARTKLTTERPLALAASQAAVEISLMYMLNRPLYNVCKIVEHDKEILQMILKCRINPTPLWGSDVVFPDSQTEQVLRYIFDQLGPRKESAPADSAHKTKSDPVKPKDDEDMKQRYLETKPMAFTALPLNNPKTRFVFLKRFSQLSGHYFPDSTASSFKTVRHAISYGLRTSRPKPTKLAAKLSASPIFNELPNVKISPNRQTPAHRDQEVGRWKLIDAELRERGLLDSKP